MRREGTSIPPYFKERNNTETASHDDVDVSEGKTASILEEQNSVGGLCDTGGGSNAIASRCSLREDMENTRELPSTRRRSLRLILKEVNTTGGTIDRHGAATSSVACYASVSPSVEVARATRRRSVGAVSRRGAHCPNAPGVSPCSSRRRSSRRDKSTDDSSSRLRTNRSRDLRRKTAKNECPVKGRQVGAFSMVVKEVTIGEESELQPLTLLLAAIEAAEACGIKHEKLSTEIGKGRTSHTTEGRKRVHFCSFDLSSVDMPRDTADGSEVPAKEIACCLARVTDAQSVVHDALRASSSHSNGFVEKWKAFLRELRILALHSKPGEAVEQSKIGLAGAARFLLAELEPLDNLKGPVYTALRGKLSNILASLVRFNLRILLNPPPEKLSVSDDAVSDRRRFSGKSARLAGPTHFSKVHEMLELSRGQPNAALTIALRRLYGYPGERAVEFVADAERFIAKTASRGKKFGPETRMENMRRHLITLADIVDAIRARRFVRSLLNSDGVREAIAEAGGWADVEKLASELKRLEGPADIHTPLTLLSDIGGFERWLDDESLWPVKAERVLEKFLLFLAPTTERPKRRRLGSDESVELLRQDALGVKQRSQLPTIKAVKHKISNSVEKAEQNRGYDDDCRRPPRNKSGGASKKLKTVKGAIIADEVVRVNGGDSGPRLSRSKPSKKRNRGNSMV